MRVVSKGNTVECPDCGSKLQYDKSDMFFDYGNSYITCPECDELICVKEYEETLVIDESVSDDKTWDRGEDGKFKCNINNVQDLDDMVFPESFRYEGGNYAISNDEINKWVKRCVDQVKQEPNGGFCFETSGNAIVVAVKNLHGDIDVFVSDDWYSYSDYM